MFLFKTGIAEIREEMHCGFTTNDINKALVQLTQFQNPVMKISVTPLHKIYNSILL